MRDLNVILSILNLPKQENTKIQKCETSLLSTVDHTPISISCDTKNLLHLTTSKDCLYGTMAQDNDLNCQLDNNKFPVSRV